MNSLPKISYLEISPRMTGKTSRLCAFANDLATTGVTVIFVCAPQLAPGLRKVMPDVTVLADGQPVPDTVNETNATWIYDDFDWLKSTRIRDGGYYATTAARTRQAGVPSPGDVLMGLIEANGNRHERHFLPSCFGGFIREHRATMSAEDFRLGMLGEFLS